MREAGIDRLRGRKLTDPRLCTAPTHKGYAGSLRKSHPCPRWAPLPEFHQPAVSAPLRGGEAAEEGGPRGPARGLCWAYFTAPLACWQPHCCLAPGRLCGWATAVLNQAGGEHAMSAKSASDASTRVSP